MHCIVTAGPTYEPLDKVRRLTNFSTGRLGWELANHLTTRGHQVRLLIGYYAEHHGPSQARSVDTFTTTADLAERLRALAASPVDAVFHAAAVSDFGFGQVYAQGPSEELIPLRSGKFSTSQGPLLAELVPTPKIIAQLRTWFPQARLVGWKYEVDGPREDCIRAGINQLQRCQTDACVVNGPAYGEGFGLVRPGFSSVHLPDKAALFNFLETAESWPGFAPK